MGATLQNSVPMKEILKPTGYDIPASVANKTWGQATSGGGAVVEDNKNVSITANGTVEITPSSGSDAMAKVTASVNVPSDAKEEQTKSVTITENGTTTVSPDSGKVLSSVSITANVETPKEDKYFLWCVSSSHTSWNAPNNWTSLCSVAGEGAVNTGSTYPIFIYIKGKESLADFPVESNTYSFTIYNVQDASDYATVTTTGATAGTNYVAILNPKKGGTTWYLSRTASADITTALTTFARFDGVTRLPTFKALSVTENETYQPANTEDGIGWVFVNVPPVVTDPSKIIVGEFTPELNTAYAFSNSAGPGGSYGLSGSNSFSSLIKASDISGGTVTTTRVTWGAGETHGYYADLSLALSGSGYPQTLTITPTDIGANWGTKAVKLCLVL